jgi:hypothetical protein
MSSSRCNSKISCDSESLWNPTDCAAVWLSATLSSLSEPEIPSAIFTQKQNVGEYHVVCVLRLIRHKYSRRHPTKYCRQKTKKINVNEIIRVAESTVDVAQAIENEYDGIGH